MSDFAYFECNLYTMACGQVSGLVSVLVEMAGKLGSAGSVDQCIYMWPLQPGGFRAFMLTLVPRMSGPKDRKWKLPIS